VLSNVALSRKRLKTPDLNIFSLQPSNCTTVLGYLFCGLLKLWPRGLRHRSAAVLLLGSRVRILLGAWMFVCCVYRPMLCWSLVERCPTLCLVYVIPATPKRGPVFQAGNESKVNEWMTKTPNELASFMSHLKPWSVTKFVMQVSLLAIFSDSLVSVISQPHCDSFMFLFLQMLMSSSIRMTWHFNDTQLLTIIRRLYT
jgi:hypothetical protein